MASIYTTSFKLKVAKEAQEARCYIDVAKNYGVSREKVREWAQAYARYGDLAFEENGPEKFNQKRIEEMEKKIADLEEENEILKKAMAYFSTKSR